MRCLTTTKLLLCAVLTLAVAACDRLPRGAPVEQEVVQVASGEIADFSVYTVTRALVPVIAEWPRTGERHLGWLPASGGARTQVIATGDQLQLTVWDSADDSLITNGEPSAVINALTVGPDGTIFVPYIGNVRISGMTTQLARQRLQEEIDVIAPSAQVQLELVEGRTNSVDLVGGVGAPGACADARPKLHRPECHRRCGRRRGRVG